MSKIHILYLIDGMNIGGAEILLRDVSSALQKRGYRIRVGYSTPGLLVDEFIKLGITPTQLPRHARVDPFLLINMLRLIRQDPPEILHTHLFKSDFHGRLAGRIAKVPVIVSTLHNSDPWALRWPLGALYGASARLADQLIAVSDEVRAYHIAHSGMEPQKIQVIQNGVNIQRFEDQENAGVQPRAQFGFDDTHIVYGIVGRLVPQKDHDTFLMAAAKIHQALPSARFLIVGDGPLRQNLQAMAKRMDLNDVVKFTGFREDLPAVLAALDVMIFTSLWEGLPVTLLEGMASSLPVVATAVDGIKSVVIPDETAYLIEPGDAASLAEKALWLGQHPDIREKMGMAGFERVAQQFSLGKMIDLTENLYLELLQKKGLGVLVSQQKVQQEGETI